ncbi:hypothetical protein [Caulobacter flavus]|uniref:hypothetical protein n=1 Tax=Caulobacter flavus TaxID=1679497 RepID=UPI0013DDE5E4|nr:hypothetical protein [Caulobacter flavus]
MPVKLTVQDHAHGGGVIVIREVVVSVTTEQTLLDAMRHAMGTYPICDAEPV